jgi:molybdopterin synthase catalytic subunit
LIGIHYSAYPAMAEAEMRRLCELHEREFPPLDAAAAVRVWIHHRLGFVPVGVASLVIRVHSAHSGEAFERCRWWLDQIKRRLPVWKRPVYRGDEVGSGSTVADA